MQNVETIKLPEGISIANEDFEAYCSRCKLKLPKGTRRYWMRIAKGRALPICHDDMLKIGQKSGVSEKSGNRTENLQVETSELRKELTELRARFDSLDSYLQICLDQLLQANRIPITDRENPKHPHNASFVYTPHDKKYPKESK